MAIVNEKKVKQAVSATVKYASGAAGFGAGLGAQVMLDKMLGPSLPTLSFLPETIRKIIPGSLVILLAMWAQGQVSDERAKAAITGLGISGGADILRRLLGPFIPWIMSNIPGNGLNGRRKRMRGMGDAGNSPINVGDFQTSYYKENAFQGMGRMSMQGGVGRMSMQGTSPFALSGPMGTSPFALSGRKGGMRGAGMLYGTSPYALS